MTNDIDATSFQKQLSQLRQDLIAINEAVTAMKRDIVETDKKNTQVFVKTQKHIDIVERVLFGSEREQHVGLIERTDRMEKVAEQIQRERRAMKQRLDGILIGLGLNGVIGTGLLAAVVQYLNGG